MSKYINGQKIIDAVFEGGAVTLPSIRFANSLTDGFYRIGTNNIGLTLNSVKTWDFGTVLTSTIAPITFTAGIAVTAASYWIGRDADGTNQFHFNTPTGAGYEFSVNDVAAFTIAGDAEIVQTIANLTGGETGFTGTYITSNDTNGTVIGHSITLAAGFTSSGITHAMTFDNICAGTSAIYSTDGTYGSRPNGNRGMGGYTRATTSGINTGLLGLARGGIVNWAAWLAATAALADKANVGSIGIGFNSASGGEGIGVYALYDNPATQPTIPADIKTALFANNAANAVDIAIFTDNGTEVLVIEDGGNFTLTPIALTSGAPANFLMTGAAHTGLTASTEVIGVNYNLSATKQFATGALTTQREFVIQAPTYGFVGASTLDLAATVAIVGAPIAGTNATITTSTALLVGSGGAVGKADDDYSIAILMDGIAAGVGAKDGQFGFAVTGNGSISLGNQTETLVDLASVSLDIITYVSTTNTRTVTNPATLFIEGAPVASTNVTFSNRGKALWVDSGVVRFDPDLTVASGASAVWDGFIVGGETIATTPTLTLTGSTNITTATGVNMIAIARPSIIAGTALTVSVATTLYLEGNPEGGGAGPATLTESNTIWVDNGTIRADEGIVFGAKSSNATLDSYNETTFAPTVTLVGGAGNTVPVYTTNTGRVTLIGNQAFVDVYLTGDGGAEGAGSGVFSVALPVASSASHPTSYFPCGYFANGTAEDPIWGQIAAGGTVIDFAYEDVLNNFTAMTGAEQNSTTRTVRLKFFYEV